MNYKLTNLKKNIAIIEFQTIDVSFKYNET